MLRYVARVADGRPAPSASAGFRADIQGLRAVAVVAVLLYHADVPGVGGGYVGVDIFFVISGFLITGHLLTRLARDGRVDLADFYAKRARRILPASFVVLALSVVGALLWFPPVLVRHVWAGAVATALYVPNLLFAVQGTNYLAETTPSLFQHYWSLGIEEQFYLLWPLALALAWRYVGRRRLLGLVALAVAASFAAGVVLTSRNQPWAFFSLPTRAWELGAGALVAVALAQGRSVRHPVVAAAVGWAGLAALLGSVVLFDGDVPFPGVHAAVPVAGTAAVVLAGAARAPGGPGRVLSLRPLVAVGTVSYSLYLVHWPALLLPQGAVGFEHPLPLGVKVALVVVCVPLAWLLHRYVETPGRTTPLLVAAPPRRTLWWAAVGSAAAVALATGAAAVEMSRPLSTATVAAPHPPSDPPRGTPVVPSNMVPSLRAAPDDQPVVYADGCHLSSASTTPADCRYGTAAHTILLFGDSHAAQWFPALLGFATSHGYALESHTKSACPSLTAPTTRNGVPYTQCEVWRDAVVAEVERSRPDLVVLANYAEVDLGGPAATREARWRDALGATLDRIDVPVVVLQDTPHFVSNPSNCLSAHLDDALRCAAPAAEAIDDEVADAVADASAARDVPVVDLDGYLCDEVCPVVIGDTLVYRDEHHLTATYAEALTDALTLELELAGVEDRA